MKLDSDFISRVLTGLPVAQESREDILALIRVRRAHMAATISQLDAAERLLMAAPSEQTVEAEVSKVAETIKFDATLRMCVNVAHKFFETSEFNEGLPNSQVLEEFASLNFDHCPDHLDFLRDDIFKIQCFLANSKNSREKRLKRIASLKSELDDAIDKVTSSETSIPQSELCKAKASAKRSDEHLPNQDLLRQVQTLVTVEEHVDFAENNMSFLKDSKWREYLIAMIAFVRDTELQIPKTFLHEAFKKSVRTAFSSFPVEYDEIKGKILEALNCLFDGVSVNSVLLTLRRQISNFETLDVDLPEPTVRSLMYLSNPKNGVEDRLRRFKRDASSGVFGSEVMIHYGKLVVELYARAMHDTKLYSTAVDQTLARSIFALAQNVIIVLDDFPAARADALDEALVLYGKNTDWKDLPKLSAVSGKKREFCVLIV